jgi:hypothetical protein
MPETWDAALGQDVRRRARHRCEYCRLPEFDGHFPHHIDHVIALKHGGQSDLSNLALCCVICNRYKGSNIAALNPANGDLVRLFNPRLDKWSHHFRVLDGLIVALTPKASATVRLLRFNDRDTCPPPIASYPLGRYCRKPKP